MGTGRFVAWAVLVVTGVWLVSAGGTYPGIAYVPAQILTQVLAVVVLGAWLVLALLRPGWRPTTPLIAPVLLVAAAYALSALLSQRPRLSLEPTIAGVGFAVTFLFLTRLLADPWFRHRIGSVVILATILVAVGYIVQVVVIWVEWWGLIGTMALPPLRPAFASLVFGSPNLVATVLLLIGPLAVVLLRARTRRLWPPTLVAILAAIAIVLAGSRGAYLGVGIALVVVLALAASRVDVRRVGVGMREMVKVRPALLVPPVVLVAAVAVLAPAIVRRFAQGGDSLRFDLWRSALTIFTDHPLTGGGPGTWVQLKVAANPPGSPNVILQHAHSIYFQTIAELGVVGVLALVVLCVAVLRRLLASWGGRDGPALEAGAVLVALAAFFGQSIVDNFVNLPSIVLLLLLVVAWVEAGTASDQPTTSPTTSPSRPVRRRFAALFPAVAIVGLVAAVPILLRIDVAGLTNGAGNDAALRGDWQTALTRYEDALAIDPDFTLYHLERAGMLARVGRPPEARAQLATAVANDPVGTNVMALATLDLASGDRQAALDHARRALALEPFEPILSLNAGIVAEGAGDPTLALDEYADAVAASPPLARAAFWSDPARTVPKAAVITAAQARSDPVSAALILAYGGDPSAAVAQLAALPAGEARDGGLAAARWLAGDERLAIVDLTARLDAERQSWITAGWLARITRLSGDPVAGARYARWAMIVEADAADSIVLELSVLPADPGDASAGLPANYPWSVYLRPIPPFLYPPQLTTMGTP